MKKPVVSFRIEPEQTEALNRLCDATGKDRTEHMRKALEIYLAANTKRVVRHGECFVCGDKHGGLQCPTISPHSVSLYIEQPDGSLMLIENAPLRMTGKIDFRKPVHVVTKCRLGEHCRCAKGHEPGCWNWPE